MIQFTLFAFQKVEKWKNGGGGKKQGPGESLQCLRAVWFANFFVRPNWKK